MQQFSLCFGKVKKDCLKFIKSQETKADKFKFDNLIKETERNSSSLSDNIAKLTFLMKNL